MKSPFWKGALRSKIFTRICYRSLPSFARQQRATDAGGLSLLSFSSFGRQLFEYIKSFPFRFKTSPIALESKGVKVIDNATKNTVLGSKIRRSQFWASKLPGCSGHASKIGRSSTVRRLIYGRSEAFPTLAFVGITLANGKGFLTKKEEMEKICEDIRATFKGQWVPVSNDSPSSEVATEVEETSPTLNNLELSKVIAKGCNAVVYEGKWKQHLEKSTEESDLTDTEATSSVNEKQAPLTTPATRLFPSFNGNDLAVKMMFNYEVESNAPAILKAMYKEIVPANRSSISLGSEFGDIRRDVMKKKYLPSHPNIVDIRYVFADRIPTLPDALNLYPDALPPRIYLEGSGRNMTLFVVMKRYDCSLAKYLHLYQPPSSTRLLLLTQLLEGVTHMVYHRIAHRDLKADNILLDLSEGLEMPRLVIADFGCCLADDKMGLSLPYYTEETDRGGNTALMAPEVATAVPSFASSIDYKKADLWAIGTLAYEIWGKQNPFYRKNKNWDRMSSENYEESQFPPLGNDVDAVIKKLISSILQKNPNKRPSAAVAANVCQLLLTGLPAGMKSSKIAEKKAAIMEWISVLAAVTMCQLYNTNNNGSSVEFNLRLSFLNRIQLAEIEYALDYF